MRPDQRIRLAEVTERLAEAVILDADPDNWSAPGKTLADMTQDERGDAAWCRKTAVQSVTLLAKMLTLQATDEGGAPAPTDPDPEAEIVRAEKAAAKALDRVMANAGR
jgi:hypothetical protein